MFGLKKTIKKTNDKEEVVLEKAQDAYNILDEVAIHTMPTRYKEMHVEGETAKKTGIIILLGGGFMLLVVIAAIGWFAFGSKLTSPKPTPQNIVSEPVATTTGESEEMPIPPPASSLTTPEPAVIVELPVVATTSTTSVEVNNQIQATTAPAVIAVDGDNDGLSDSEEDILGSSRLASDSDGDLFADMTELLNNYNPAGAGKLTDNQSIATYSNSAFSLTYPRAWVFKAGDGNSVIFNTPDNQMVSISIDENQLGLGLEDWYKEEFRVTSIDANQLIVQPGANLTNPWRGIKSSDGLTYYLMNNSKSIIAVNYNLGPSNTLNYPNLFKTSVMSFKFR